jgi:hypothetical protein
VLLAGTQSTIKSNGIIQDFLTMHPQLSIKTVRSFRQ